MNLKDESSILQTSKTLSSLKGSERECEQLQETAETPGGWVGQILQHKYSSVLNWVKQVLCCSMAFDGDVPATKNKNI